MPSFAKLILPKHFWKRFKNFAFPRHKYKEIEMSENSQNDSSTNNDSNSEYYDRRAARRQRIEERRAGRSGSWVVGAILILVGIVIMLQNLTSFDLENWWALFILIPALGAFGNAWRAYQKDERLSAPARASLISGVILTMVTAVFLLGLNWTILGPILLILAGVGLLLNVALPG
jgi:peptidoglycan/LPS O-acetylase OafA/YrhL